MNPGRSLSALAAELERQTNSRKDYVAPQGKLVAEVLPAEDNRPGQIVIAGLNGDAYGLTPHAHRQVADHLGIPQKYYDRMLGEQPELLTRNMNVWLGANRNDTRMVRTLDGNVRAFMSSKYRPLDNYELANVVLPKLIALKAEILSCELTETRMYIKAILPSLSDKLPEGVVWGQGHVRVADYNGEKGRVVASICISNSDVGAGTLRVEPSVFTTWCSNLAVMTEMAMKKYHVGSRHELAEDLSIYRDETREASDAAFWMKVQDVTDAAFNPEVFQAAVRKIAASAELKIESDDLKAVVTTAVRTLALPERTEGSILSMLARGGDISQWGLSSAITATANTEKDYEVATDLERAGGKVLVLAGRDWQAISKAVRAA